MMSRCLLALSLHACLALASLGAPPTDAQVQRAAQIFAELDRAGAQDPGTRPADIIKWGDTALEGIDTSALTLSQINTLVGVKVFPYASASRDVEKRLATLSKEPTIDGADAAALRLSFLAFERDPSSQQAIIRDALRHPKLGEALREGRALSLFSGIAASRRAVLQDLLAMKDVLSTDLAPEVVARAAALIDVVVGVAGDDNAEIRQPLRQRLLEMVRAALAANPADEGVRTALTKAEIKLDGAFMKGELIGHPAPPLDFTWSTFETPVSSLADLKGKVVVLFFWRTTCDPCVAAFTDVRLLQSHYASSPVVILGVTSLQGVHKGAEGIVDCAGDADKEHALMAEFVKAARLPWQVAFTAQDVFNTPFGVMSIPELVIVDTKGVVRHRKIHPNNLAVPLAEKVEKIDALLKEAGLEPPKARR